uniref:Uncharacterized protein n=1 Tax=Corvus moneduloides TaxID=1196302 RepID=A0A8U7NLX4_CORMO
MGARHCCVVIGCRVEPWDKELPENSSQSERAALLTTHWSGLELPVQRGCFGAGGTCPALAMGRVAAAGAVLVALVVLGAPPAAGTELSGVLQEMVKSECHFINGTARVSFVERHIYNRQQYVHLDSDVGVFVGDTPDGEKVARYWNSDPEWMEYMQAAVHTCCRHNYEVFTPFLMGRRVPPSVSISLVPSSSQPGPSCLLCSGMDFYPVQVQLRWFQGQQGLSGHVVATDIVPNGVWTHQLLVLLETAPARGQLQLPGGARQPGAAPEPMPLDASCSKMLTGTGGFVLGFVFLVLGFYLSKQVTGGPGGCIPPSPRRVCSPGAPQPGVTPFALPTELLSRRQPQPLPVASGPAGTPRSIPALILGGSCVPPSPAVTLPLLGCSKYSQ